jgi:hypothetical protein
LKDRACSTGSGLTGYAVTWSSRAGSSEVAKPVNDGGTIKMLTASMKLQLERFTAPIQWTI